MPSADLLARTSLPVGVTVTPGVAIDAVSEQVTVTVVRFDNGADALGVRYFVDGEFAGGGASQATNVETLAGPFAAGAVFTAELDAPDSGIEVMLALTWG